MTNSLPILYSFRRCPYAIRARLTLTYTGIPVETREIELKHKPEHMLAISPKGTVPVLQLPDGQVIDESLDIMTWALAKNDPEHWLITNEETNKLIFWNDSDFKYYLDRYKYADRYPEFPESYYRDQAGLFLAKLEGNLSQSSYLGGMHFSIVDAAIFPFIRQFVAVDSQWFTDAGHQHLSAWLTRISAMKLFASVMTKHPVWCG